MINHNNCTSSFNSRKPRFDNQAAAEFRTLEPLKLHKSHFMPQSRGQVKWNSSPAQGKLIHNLKPNYREHWKALIYITVCTVGSVVQADPSWKILYDLCAIRDTPSVARLTSNIPFHVAVHVCVCSTWYMPAVMGMEWQPGWSEVMMQQPYCPDPARGVLISTVLKVQLGTSVLLTTTHFQHLIPCPVCKPVITSHYIFSFVAFDQSHGLCPTDKKKTTPGYKFFFFFFNENLTIKRKGKHCSAPSQREDGGRRMFVSRLYAVCLKQWGWNTSASQPDGPYTSSAVRWARRALHHS